MTPRWLTFTMYGSLVLAALAILACIRAARSGRELTAAGPRWRPAHARFAVISALLAAGAIILAWLSWGWGDFS